MAHLKLLVFIFCMRMLIWYLLFVILFPYCHFIFYWVYFAIPKFDVSTVYFGRGKMQSSHKGFNVVIPIKGTAFFVIYFIWK
jgi:hypothetical protein